MKRIIYIFFLCLAVSYHTTQAQTHPTALSSSDILFDLQKLNTVGAVLYIAAHPDDENTRLLPYLTKELKLRTGYLSLTRGDGGQNLIGKEQGVPLGVLRTQELLEARKIDGAEQFFSKAYDFGFSKNPEETFNFWNKDSVLADVVWTIRRFKPDVLILRFPTTGEGGHGHHTASAILGVEAFAAAADPTRFPEQLAYTEPWQARRIFWNTFNFGTTNTITADQLKIDVGGYNPLLGKSYGEIAGASRSMHKSQGFGTAHTRGSNLEYFKQLGGDVVEKELFEKINLSWTRFPAARALDKKIEKAIRNFDLAAPEKTVPALVEIYKEIAQLDEKDPGLRSWKKIKLKETEKILLACSGVWLEAYADAYSANPGGTLGVAAQLVVRSNVSVTLQALSFQQQDTLVGQKMQPNELYTFRHSLHLPSEMSYSAPYWLQKEHSPGSYEIPDRQQMELPENNPPLQVGYRISIHGLSLTVARPVTYKYTDPAKGELYRPVEILPPATLNFSEQVYVFHNSDVRTIQVHIKAHTQNLKGTVEWQAPAGWEVSCIQPSVALKAKGDETVVELKVKPSASLENNKGKLSVAFRIGEQKISKSIHRIEYDHIPYQFILSESEVTLVGLSLKKSGNRIGYIPGAGDGVDACLRQVGYEVTLLTDELLSHSDLSVYDAILTGIRTYNVQPRMQTHYSKLMNYVKGGGNLVVQYNTNNRIGPLLAEIGPYPFTISRDRVTDEKAEVRILNPAHPVFSFPNKIKAEDFDGWVQERGIYFAVDTDKNYEALLSMNDPGEAPHEGSLITARYGKGNFVYTGLVFFRELPAGIPGAYRLLANLLSLPQNK
jgi:LmbE family N-acetylglucosaminyl deacetylase